MSTAEVVDVEGRQTVKLPAEIHIDGKVVSVRREGKAVILEPVASSESPRDSWPDGSFDAIHVDDPSFRRPEQGSFPGDRAASPNEAEVVYIGAGAFLRAMIAIAWSCFRHPFSATNIDLATGKVINAESAV